MKRINLNSISSVEYNSLLKRPIINFDEITQIVKPILTDIKRNGKKAVLKYAEKFDGLANENLKVTKDEIVNSAKYISDDLKQAIQIAIDNITAFHKHQIPSEYEIETMPGVNCGRFFKPINQVGLYVPGGTAPLFSTLLMLAIPAKIAGCKRIVICSPAINGKLSNELLYSANLLDIEEIYKVGGAQAIGMLAYGTEEIDKVDKIFGPGNQFVTNAKSIVSIDPDGCSIDMPAGPSEVLVIADQNTDHRFTAADLLSQAEHGKDSQVILLSCSNKFIDKVIKEINIQLLELPRKEIAEKSLKKSLFIYCDSIDEAINFSNQYAPEHLILQFKNAKKYLQKIENAGSVFLGSYSPESLGDYASGTNHSLPTYGYAKTYSGVNVLSFMKGITYQQISNNGIKKIGSTVIKLANAESLNAHAKAVEIRLDD